MEQSIIMIPMINPANGSHRAIARIRFVEGRAQVETRWSGFNEEEELFLLTNRGYHHVTNGRVSCKNETLYGIASMSDKGVCGCCGAVRGHEADFERALVNLRIDRQSSRPVTTRGEAAPEAPTLTDKSAKEVSSHSAIEAELVSAHILPHAEGMPKPTAVEVTQIPAHASTDAEQVLAEREPDAIEVMHSRAMDDYALPVGVTPGAGFSDIMDDAVKIFVPASTPREEGIEPAMPAPIEGLTQNLPAHPQVEGEEPGWPVFNRAMGEKTAQGSLELSVNNGYMPANAPNEWPVIDEGMLESEIPIYEPSEALNETLMRARGLFPPEENRGLEDTDSPYPFVMPQNIANPFPKQFPASTWIKIQRLQGQGYYLEGHMRRGNENMTITAAPGEYSPVPPRYLQGFNRFIQTKDGGFWVRMRKE